MMALARDKLLRYAKMPTAGDGLLAGAWRKPGMLLAGLLAGGRVVGPFRSTKTHARLAAVLKDRAPGTDCDPVDEAEASRRRVAFLVSHLRSCQGHPSLGDPVKVVRIAAAEQSHQAERLKALQAELASIPTGQDAWPRRRQLMREIQEASALQGALQQLMRRTARRPSSRPLGK